MNWRDYRNCACLGFLTLLILIAPSSLVAQTTYSVTDFQVPWAGHGAWPGMNEAGQVVGKPTLRAIRPGMPFSIATAPCRTSAPWAGQTARLRT